MKLKQSKVGLAIRSKIMTNKKCARRYDEGGDVEEDGVDSAIKQGMALKNAVGAKRESFGEAFKRNKASGEKTFEFGGKKYTTATKDDSKKSGRLNRLAQDAGTKFSRLSSAVVNRPKETSETAERALIKAAQDASNEYSMRNAAAGNKMASGGKVKSASSRADGCAIRGKTRA
jgi:hypothetical protein